ncbi:MAG: hypothetical protein ACI8UO_002684 [Verrucomicrobiales bacterium]|jgi:hypothetical protein
MSNPNVILCCGGSGLEAGVRLNRKLVHDPYWAPRLDQDLYFVGIDTNTDDLKKFRSDLQEDSRSVNQPFIQTIQTSASLQKLGPVVHRDLVEPYENGRNPAGLERLKKHWWFKNDKPATAPRVYPLFKGAGQQPAVSFYLTWKHLATIGRQFDELVHEIINRRSHMGVEHPPLHHLNVLLVSGLAGGTGRGGWQLVAAKAMDSLNRAIGDTGQAISPVCFFLDASCYPDRFENISVENKLRANSLTGFSELSAWLGKEEEHELPYRLPSIEHPESEEADLIQLNEITGGSPLYSAMLTFGRNDMAVIGKSEDGFDMVASSLYALITHSVIQSVQINKGGYPFWGIGSAVYEVPIEDLKSFFEQDARRVVCEELISYRPGDVAKEAGSFYKTAGLNINALDMRMHESKHPSELQLLGRFARRHQDLMEAAFDNLDSALESQDTDESLEMARAFDAELIDQNLVRQALNGAILDGLGDKTRNRQEKGPKDLAEALLESAITGASSILHRHKSLQAAYKFLDEVTEKFRKQIQELQHGGLGSKDQGVNDPAVTIEKEGNRLLRRKPFNEGVRKDILFEARVHLMHSSVKQLLACLNEVYAAMMGKIRPLKNQLADAAQHLRLRAQKFGEAAAKLEKEKALFTTAETADRSIVISKKRFQTRKIRPIKPESQDYGETVSRDSLLELLAEQIQISASKPDATRPTERQRAEHAITEIVNSEVGVSPSLLEQFQIERVINKLRNFWIDHLHGVRNDAPRFNDLSRRFYKYFGVKVGRSDNGNVVLEDGRSDLGFLTRMGAALVTVCRPYWSAKRSEDEGAQNVYLFMPTVISDSELDGVHQDIRGLVGQDLNVQPKVYGRYTPVQDPNVVAKVDGNPYMMLAYSDEAVLKLEDIRSLDYWKGKPALQQLLEAAESTIGESMFSRVGADLGIGYADPRYVIDPSFASRRWRPWYRAGANGSSAPADSSGSSNGTGDPDGNGDPAGTASPAHDWKSVTPNEQEQGVQHLGSEQSPLLQPESPPVLEPPRPDGLG